MKDVWEEQMPTLVAPEGLQAHQSFIADTTPELAGAFEPALILAAGRFHRAAAQRFSRPAGRRVVHPLSVAFQIVQFARQGLPFLLAQSFGQGAQVL